MLKDKILWIIVTILIMVGACVLNDFIFGDELLLYTMMFLTFILILVANVEKRTRIWNFALFAGYNTLLLYCFYCKDSDGTSLCWWIFLLFF